MIEEKLNQLEKAHARLYNNYKNLFEDFFNYRKQTNDRIDNLIDQINELKKTSETKSNNSTELVIGGRYVDKIKNILGVTDIINYKGKQFKTYTLQLKEKEQIFEAFISNQFDVRIGHTIGFTYDNNNQLRSVKIYE